MKKNYALNKLISMAKIFLLCTLTVNVAFGQVNKTTSKSEKSSSNHPAATAQDMNVRPAEMSRTAKSGENSSTATGNDLKLNAERPAGLVHVEAKINALLDDIRVLLKTASVAERFNKILEKTLTINAEQVCPSLDLVYLIKGSAVFRASSKNEKQELYSAVDLLIDVLDELSAN